LNEYYFGLVVLIAILAGRFAVGRWRLSRFQRLWGRAQEAVQAGNWVAAEAALRDCVRLMPIAGPVHRLMGVVLARRGKLGEAEERIRFGAELEPRNPAGFMELGFFLTARYPERFDEAIDAFSTAVQNAPDLRKALSQEPRLEPLRQHERFCKLVEVRD
jgi:Tfp pilus assembly protein PilF